MCEEREVRSQESAPKGFGAWRQQRCLDQPSPRLRLDRQARDDNRGDGRAHDDGEEHADRAAWLQPETAGKRMPRGSGPATPTNGIASGRQGGVEPPHSREERE